MKIAMFTDIHWGAKGNSAVHNSDCMDFIRWFTDRAKEEKADAIVFLGDWFENRNAINVGTLNASYEGFEYIVKAFPSLPIYMIIGNHDLYHRSNRKSFSTNHFKTFENVILVNELTKFPEINGIICPFLFRDEYPVLAANISKLKPKYVFGHFEFKNFVVTGSDRRIEHGPDHTQFTGPTYIFSGHFHKRQVTDNIVYIGNAFPSNYGDVFDKERGMCVLDTDTDDVYFIDWEDAPLYFKYKLSVLLDSNVVFPPKSTVKCIVDIEISYSEAQAIKEQMIKDFNLKDFRLEEDIATRTSIVEGETIDIGEMTNIDDAVIKMLAENIPASANIHPATLIEIYEKL